MSSHTFFPSDLCDVRVPRVLAGAPVAQLLGVLVGPLDPRRPHLQRRRHSRRHLHPPLAQTQGEEASCKKLAIPRGKEQRCSRYIVGNWKDHLLLVTR